MSTDTTTGPPPAPESDIDTFYIRTPSSLADDRTLVLKEGDTFVVFDRYGDIRPVGMGEEGLYHGGTRFLSELSLRVGDRRALLLSSAVKSDNALIAVDLTNPDMEVERAACWRAARSTLADDRAVGRRAARAAARAQLRQRADRDAARAGLRRGLRRHLRGARDGPPGARRAAADQSWTRAAWCLATGPGRRDAADAAAGPSGTEPRDIASRAHRSACSCPHGEDTFDIFFACEQGENRPRRVTFAEALKASADTLAAAPKGCLHDRDVEHAVQRVAAPQHRGPVDDGDRGPSGPYPYAGVPWFSTPFGRDGIITALECLWAAPGARARRAALSRRDAGDTSDPELDAQPGKILHEAREGEMAATRRDPVRAATTAASTRRRSSSCWRRAYYERTGDRASIERHLAEHRSRAARGSTTTAISTATASWSTCASRPTGLVHQGWKDSHDSVFHRDGRPGRRPDRAVRGAGLRLRGRGRARARLARLLERTCAGR